MGSRGRKRRPKEAASSRARKPAAPPLIISPPRDAAPRWARAVLPIMVAAAAFVTFLPALDAGFVNWDDDKLFLDNPKYRGLSWSHITWMFETTKMGHWQPLSWITLGLDHRLYGVKSPPETGADRNAGDWPYSEAEPVARGYHLTNMLLHVGCAVAFYFLTLRLLTLAVGPINRPSGVVVRIAAALAALFFAVHPLRVESVAWVTERRDLLSGLFFVLTINTYLRSRTTLRHRWAWYTVSVVIFVLSVLSKAWGMTIPVVLILLDAYPLRRRKWNLPASAIVTLLAGCLFFASVAVLGVGLLSEVCDVMTQAAKVVQSLELLPYLRWGTAISTIMIVLGGFGLWYQSRGQSTRWPWASMGIWLEKLPFVIIALVVALQAIGAQGGQVDTVKSLAEHSLVPRAAQVLYGAAFYVWKTLLPFKLIPLYELNQVQKNPWELRFVIGALAVIIVAVVLMRMRRRWPAALAAAACYLAIYSPVSGVAQSGPQLVKDSYSYLCCLSWAVLLGGVLLWLHRRWGPRCSAVAAGAGVVWVSALAVASWRQAGVWHDSKTLWAHTLRIDDRCALAHNNLGILIKKEGRLKEAAEHYRRSLEINPDKPDTHFNYANCLKAQKRYDRAIEHYRKAIELQKVVAMRPIHDQAHANLGNTYSMLGNLDGAIEHHRIAARVKRNPELNNLLGVNLRKKATQLTGPRRDVLLDEAEKNFLLAIKRKPRYPTALCNLGELLIERGRCAEAVGHLRRALELKPGARRPRRLLQRAESECRE